MRIVRYMLHDPVQNVEGVIQDYDVPALEEAERGGCLVIAVGEDGQRSVVPASTVRAPEPMVEGVRIATAEYVDARARAVLSCLEALPVPMGEDNTLAEALDGLRALVEPKEAPNADLRD